MVCYSLLYINNIDSVITNVSPTRNERREFQSPQFWQWSTPSPSSPSDSSGTSSTPDTRRNSTRHLRFSLPGLVDCVNITLLAQILFRLQVEPLRYEKHKISFKMCSSIEELALVINFLINYEIDISGKLSVMYFKWVISCKIFFFIHDSSIQSKSKNKVYTYIYDSPSVYCIIQHTITRCNTIPLPLITNWGHLSSDQAGKALLLSVGPCRVTSKRSSFIMQ